MWLFRSSKEGLSEIILYGYSPIRSGSHAKEFLEGYNGYLETDGCRRIRICRELGAPLDGWHIIQRYYIDVVPNGKRMTTVRWKCRESSVATGYSPLRTPLTKSISVIMNSESIYVSRN